MRYRCVKTDEFLGSDSVTTCSKRSAAEGYENWLSGPSFVGMDGDTLFVSVPDRETRTWLKREYADLVLATAFATWGCRSATSATKPASRAPRKPWRHLP